MSGMLQAECVERGGLLMIFWALGRLTDLRPAV